MEGDGSMGRKIIAQGSEINILNLNSTERLFLHYFINITRYKNPEPTGFII